MQDVLSLTLKDVSNLLLDPFSMLINFYTLSRVYMLQVPLCGVLAYRLGGVSADDRRPGVGGCEEDAWCRIANVSIITTGSRDIGPLNIHAK